MPRRSIIYIDGFNLYHRALRPLGMQWLDVEAFFKRLRKDDDIRRINYFTAELSGKERAGHLAYVAALKTRPLVRVIPGVHQTQHTDCSVAGCTFGGLRKFFYFKEKRTDVNIALQMLNDAHRNACDLFVLISGDSDLVPVVEMVKAMQKEVYIYIPSSDENSTGASELRQKASMSKNLPLKTLDRAQFPDPIPDGKGGTLPKHLGW